MATLIRESTVSVSEKLEKGDVCVIIGADKAFGNIGMEVDLLQFIPCCRDGNSRVEVAGYIFNNTADDAAWIVQHTIPECGLEYVTPEGKLDYGQFALIKCSHLKLECKGTPAPELIKPVIHCG